MARTVWVETTQDQLITMLVNEYRNAIYNVFRHKGIPPTPESAEWVTLMVAAKRKAFAGVSDQLERFATEIHDILDRANHRGSAPLDTEMDGNNGCWLANDPLDVAEAILNVVLSERQKELMPHIIAWLRPH